MTKKQRDYAFFIDGMRSLGFTWDEAEQLRRIEMTLHRWGERECGDDNGCIERDETTGKPYWLSSHSMKRYPIADKERGALKRLEKIMAAHPELVAYHQGDPRGCALYIVRKSDLPEGSRLDSCYTRGFAVAA